ncbi:helix-turn-helix domain-containing protein [Nonomuraea ceibae]|uniref:helix-turn-helix domain-containing protein n=1 Tax=Nonomuraea ceibae TaxID=1935170 RepID=UPI001C5F11D1|nr:helix-turn-helix transcriptional regulator [Nonomuraea ceibae]
MTEHFHPLKFRLMRVKAGMGRAELARKIRIKTGSLKDWEIGRADPGWQSLFKAAKVLGCEVADFKATPDWTPDEDDRLLLEWNIRGTGPAKQQAPRMPHRLEDLPT